MECDLSANRTTKNVETAEPSAASHAALKGLVRLLARQAAREWVEQQADVRRRTEVRNLPEEQT